MIQANRIKRIAIILVYCYLLGTLSMNSASPVEFSDIAVKGDRNLKIISKVYEKYSFMPAKKEYLRNIQEDWIKVKIEYSHARPGEKKEKLEKLVKSYQVTNDVLKDICIDMANLTEIVVDDFTQKLVESENIRTDLGRDKNYNRYLVSRNEFSRADNGFKRGMYYYSARLYDHGIDIMKNIYQERRWTFPKGKTAEVKTKGNIS